jgi:probable F420-dependent oxidoreductase
MRFGLALPQYDSSVPGESPLQWETVLASAQHAEALGFDSLWLSDHLFWDLARYGGPPDRIGLFEPLVTLAALARAVSRPRLGTLVLCEALRTPTMLAKALATLDRISEGRLDVGIGAGWYEPEFEAIGLEMPPPGERLARLSEALTVLRGLLDGGPLSFEGRFHRAAGAENLPAAVQRPTPPLFVGGKGDRLLRLAAEQADGWIWTRDAYRARLDVLDAACERVGRDPSTVWKSLGLYALCGESESDLERRFERMRATGPPGVLDGVTLADWRHGRLVGTADEIRDQVASWAALGVETLMVSVGPVPFSISHPEDVDAVADALASTRSGG